MYYSLELIKPVFTGIYNAFVSDLTTSAKRKYVEYEIQKAVIMVEGFTHFLDEATHEDIERDLKILNDTLLKFQGMYHTVSSDSDLKQNIQKVVKELLYTKGIFDSRIEEVEDKEIDLLMKERMLETLGGTDADYEPFLKMEIYE